MAHPKPSRIQKHGRYQSKYKDLDMRSLGHQSFGKATVDCCYYASQARWGQFGGKNVGVLYLKLAYSQTPQDRLSWARVHMELGPSEQGQSSPQIREPFAPDFLPGTKLEEIQATGTRWWRVKPRIDATSLGGFEGFDVGRIEEYIRTHRSIFVGNILPDGEGPEYRKIAWLWVSNPAEPQTEGRLPVHLGIVVEHESEPFSVKVWVEGKLRSRLRRLRFGFQKMTRTMGEISPGTNTGDLSSAVENLHRQIAEKNGSVAGRIRIARVLTNQLGSSVR